MSLLLPHVYRFFILCSTLENQAVDNPDILDIAILFKFNSDSLPNLRRGLVKPVILYNRRCLLIKLLYPLTALIQSRNALSTRCRASTRFFEDLVATGFTSGIL